MKTIRIIATGDTHICEDFSEDVKHALDQITEKVKELAPDYFFHGGDLFHHRGSLKADAQLMARSWLMDVLDAGNTLENTMEAYIISGNHDLDLAGGTDLITAALCRKQDGSMRELEMKLFVNALPSARWLDPDFLLISLPSFSKYTYTGDYWERDFSAYLEGLKLDALEQRPASNDGTEPFIMGLFHGTISGALADNETTMRRGVDMAIPADAFDGFNLVHAQHLHKAQELRSPDGCFIIYGGSTQKMTANDRWENPSICSYEITKHLGEWAVTCERLPLDMRTRWLNVTIDQSDLEWEEECLQGDLGTITEMVAHILEQKCDELNGFNPKENHKTRLRLCLKLRGSLLSHIGQDLEDEITNEMGFGSVNIIKEKIEESVKGLDVDLRKVEIPEVVGIWADLDEGLEAWRADLIAFAEEIEADGASTFEDETYDLEPLEIKLTNWKQWGVARLLYAELGQMVAVTGDNTSGKSNLLEAEAFALYGKLIKGGDLHSCITVGEDECIIDYEFHSHGERWKIMREVKRATVKELPVGRQTLRLFKQISEGYKDNPSLNWMLEVAENIRATQKKIDALAGDWEFFRLTRYASSDDISALVSATPSQLLDILQGVLQVDLEGREGAAKMKAKDIQKKLSTAQSKAMACEKARELLKMPTAPDFGEYAEYFGIDISKAQTVTFPDEIIAPINLKIEGQKNAITITEDEILKTTKAKAELEGEASSLMSNFKLIPEMETGLEKVSAELKRNEGCQARDIKKLNEMKSGAESLTVLKGRIEERADIIEAASNDLKATEKELRAVEVNLNSGGLAEGQIKSEIRAAEKAAVLLASTPCMGREMEAMEMDEFSERAQVDCSECGFIKEANDVGSEDGLRKMRIQLEKIQTALTGLRMKSGALCDEIQKIKNLWRKVEDLQIEDKIKLESLSHITGQEKIFESWAGSIKQLKEEHSRKNEELEVLKGKKLAGAEEDLRLGKLMIETCERISRLEADREIEKGELYEYQDSLKMAEKALQLAEVFLQSCEDYSSQLDALDHSSYDALQKETECKRSAEVASLYIKSMGRAGVPFVLLQRSIPRFQELVNLFLKPLDLRYFLEDSNQSQDGKSRDELVQYFTDQRGSFYVCESSGFQRNALGMCLRTALAAVHAEVNGSKIFQLIQDEGWGPFDAERIPMAVEIIRSFSEAVGGRVITITHKPQVAEACDQQILVTASAEGSTFSIEGGK